MGMRTILRKGVKAGLKGIGDIKVNITYHVATEGTRSGRGAPAVTYADKTIQATIVNYNNNEISSGGGLIAPGDRKVIMEKRLFTALSVTPKKTDQMTLDDSNVYKIINPRIDPSNNVYFFQVRQVE